MENQPQHTLGNAPTDPSQKKNIGMAIIAYVLFFVPLLTDSKNDPFVKFHVKQGLALFIAGCILSVVSWMPLLHFIGWVANVAFLVFMIIGIINAANGKEEPLPLIGHFSTQFKF